MPDDVSVDALHMTSPLRTGRRVGRTIYAQLGPEPSDVDPLVATADSPVLAERIVRAVNAAAPVAGEDTASPDDDAPRGLDQATTMDAWTLMGHVGDAINHRSPKTPVAVWVDGHPREVIGAEYDEDVERLFIKTRREIGWGDKLAVPAFIATYVPENDDGTEFVVEYIGGPSDRWHRWAVRGAESTAAEVVRTLLPRVHAVRVHRGECGGSEPGSERSAPAQPTEAPEGRRAAPTRDALGFDDLFGLPVGSVVRAANGNVGEVVEPHEHGMRWTRDDPAPPPYRVLSGGGADGGEEDEDEHVDLIDSDVDRWKQVEPGTDAWYCTSPGYVGDCTETRAYIERLHGPVREVPPDWPEGEETYSWSELADEFKVGGQQSREYAEKQGRETGRVDLFALGRSEGRMEAEARIRRFATLLGSSADTPAIVSRLARAAGVSPDSEDVVGEIEEAIRAGREPERMLGRDAEKLPRGSWVTHHADFDGGRAFPRMKTAGEGWQPENVTNGLVGHEDYVVLHRAPAPAPAPLTLGDVVTGARAVSAPVGTTLGGKSSASAAVHTVNGWSVTGLHANQQNHVRVNEWVVLALGDGGGA